MPISPFKKLSFFVPALLFSFALGAVGVFSYVFPQKETVEAATQCTHTPDTKGLSIQDKTLSSKFTTGISVGSGHAYKFTTGGELTSGSFSWVPSTSFEDTPLVVTITPFRGDFSDSMPPECRGKGTISNAKLGVSSTWSWDDTSVCLLKPNTTYYMNVRIDEDSSCTSNCGYIMQPPSPSSVTYGGSNFTDSYGGSDCSSSSDDDDSSGGTLSCPASAPGVTIKNMSGSTGHYAIQQGQKHAFVFTTGGANAEVTSLSWGNFPSMGGPADLRVSLSNVPGASASGACGGDISQIGSISYSVGGGNSKTCNLQPNTTYYANVEAVACSGTCGYGISGLCSGCSPGTGGDTCTATAPSGDPADDGGTVDPFAFCGNNTCDSNESCSTCSADCGKCSGDDDGGDDGSGDGNNNTGGNWAPYTPKLGSPTSGTGTLFDFLLAVIGIMMKIIVPFIAVFIIYSGFLFLTAQGNEEQLIKAKKNFVWVVVGATILLTSWLLANVIKNTVDLIAS